MPKKEKAEGRRVNVGKFQPFLTPEEEKTLRSMKDEGESETFNKIYEILVKEGLNRRARSAKMEPSKPISKELEPSPAKFDMAEWIALRSQTCPNCQSRPFKGKDGLWYVICPKPKEWKEGRYGRLRPTKGAKGKVHIQICQSTQAFLMKRKLKPVVETQKEKAEAEEGVDLSKLPKIRKLTTDEIVDQIGVCLNPILSKGPVVCRLCQMRRPQKWQVCQEIQKELKIPVADRKFIQAMIERVKEERNAREDPYWWWGAPKTEDMTLEEIEKELGFDEDNKFEAYRKRYHEICEDCEEHLYHRCTRYCKEFHEGLSIEMEVLENA